MDGLQADKSAVATLSKTKELKKAFLGLERVVSVRSRPPVAHGSGFSCEPLQSAVRLKVVCRV